MKKAIKNNIKKVVALSTVGLVTLSLVGGGVASAYDDDAEDRYEEQVKYTYAQKTTQEKLKTRAEVKEIVIKKLGNSAWVESIELSDDYVGQYIYEVEAQVGYTDYKLKVDAKTGKVLSSRIDY
ncbi:MAG: PepSY domain-containing protein [Gemella sp.]|nr:PepSY domain-containing protein [Gemella sp.]